jgi:hypothetical protein
VEFSGTDYVCLLLPHPLSYDPPDDASILATNDKMVEYLILRTTYCSFVPHSENGSDQDHNDLSEDFHENIDDIILDKLVDFAKLHDADAFIDAGALLCNHPMDNVAKIFLSRLTDKFKGVVYFRSTSAKKTLNVSSWTITAARLRTNNYCNDDAKCRVFDERLFRSLNIRIFQWSMFYRMRCITLSKLQVTR